MLSLCFVFGVVTQRFAIPFGSLQLPIAFFIYWFAAFWLTVQGVIILRRTACALLCIGCSCILTSASLAVGKPSLSSLFYLLGLYLPLSLGSTKVVTARDMTNASRLFVNMMLGFAMLALWQFASQQFFHIAYVDLLDQLPEAYILQGYLTSYPVTYGAFLFKSNAYLFLEASLFSQFVALAIVIELWVFRRASALVVLFMALATSFSGTGVMLIAAVSPVLFVLKARDVRTILLTLLTVTAVAWAIVARPTLFDRISEFGQRDTSASARFVEPYRLMAQESLLSTPRFLVGYGAGAADRMITTSDALINFSAIPKAMIEYGAVGGLGLLITLGIRLAVSGQPPPVVVALLVMHYFLSGALLQPISALLLFYFTVSSSSKIPVPRPHFPRSTLPIGEHL
jgi:hypothetical protein